MSQVLFGLATSLWLLYAARVLGGVLSSATLPVLAAYVADLTTDKARSRGMAWMGTAHERLSGHMTQPSWKMGGGHMAISVHAGRFRSVGSRLRLSGRVFGIMLNVEEVIVDHQPPYRKTWETIGEPRLLVIGGYRMTCELTPRGTNTAIRVSIEYARPARGFPHVLGILFADYFARWCTHRMVADAIQHFVSP